MVNTLACPLLCILFKFYCYCFVFAFLFWYFQSDLCRLFPALGFTQFLFSPPFLFGSRLENYPIFYFSFALSFFPFPSFLKACTIRGVLTTSTTTNSPSSRYSRLTTTTATTIHPRGHPLPCPPNPLHPCPCMAWRQVPAVVHPLCPHHRLLHHAARLRMVTSCLNISIGWYWFELW